MRIDIYTDGSCSPNPGIGGWAAACYDNGKKKYVAGYEHKATNNSMELKAVIEAVKAVMKPRTIIIHTDSNYLISNWAHTEEWLTAPEHANHQLWFELIKAVKNGKHEIQFVKLEGHSGNPMNEYVDKLAKEQVVAARHTLIRK